MTLLLAQRAYQAGRSDPLKVGAQRLDSGAQRLDSGAQRLDSGAQRLDSGLISGRFSNILARFFACAMVEK